MFERYSENARRTLFFARYEASGSPSIEVHHLLLGLIREGQEVTARIFAEAGVSLPDLRREIEELVPRRTSIPTSVEIPFSAYTKKALHAAAEEAERFLHNHIGPEHLLVGLLRIDDSPAAKPLTGKGVGPATVREAIAAMPSVAGLPGHKTPPLRTLKAAIAYAWDCDERYVDMSDDEARRGLLMTMAGTHADADKVELRDAIEKRFGLTVTREVRMPFQFICRSLEELVGRPLVNETNLPGVYDLELTSSAQTWRPSLMRCARRRDSSSRLQRATSPTLSCGEGS